MIIHNPILTGSFTVNGTDVASITGSAASITALNSYTASQNILNGTYATTGSNTFAAPQTINSNLTVTGSITAQTLVVQTITSSIDFVTGSTRFGSIIDNTHQFTGSVGITGSLNTSGKITANGGGLLLELNGGSDTFLRVTGNRGNGDNLHVGNLEIYNSFSSRLVGEIRGITGAGGTQSNSGQLAFYTNNNGTYDERMKIYSEGQIGIKGAATTEAAYALFTNDANTGFFNIFAGGSGTATKGIKLKVTNGSSTIDAMTITSGGNVQIGTVANSTNNIFEVYRNDVRMVAQDNNNGTAGYFMRVMNGGTQVGNATVRVDNAGALKFFTGTSSEATQMTITSGGNVLIGTTTDDARLTIYPAGSGYGQVINHTNATNQYFISFRYNGSTIGTITGNNSNTSYNTSSDYRLKQDLKQYNGLDLVSAIKTYDYQWKIDESRMYGVLAHELSEVLPYAVSGEKDGEEMQGVDYSKIVPVLVKAIQELQAQITELKNK